ncbi:MAG: hypothetical protein QOE30_2902, partial [Mycobacterium sp.]|uniref:hypothetical protein n=1 Tax=Mycobacterium sp. TaxID=1785 RepID=UPI0028BAD139
TAPEDYRKPDQFFARTWFTRALREHAGMVLRRLSGRTDNAACEFQRKVARYSDLIAAAVPS